MQLVEHLVPLHDILLVPVPIVVGEPGDTAIMETPDVKYHGKLILSFAKASCIVLIHAHLSDIQRRI